MSKIKYSKSHQAGFSEILIVVLVIALIAVAVFLFRDKVKLTQEKDVDSPSPSSQETVSEVDKFFDKSEGKAYTFYYPKGYIEGTKDPKEVLMFENPNSNAISPEFLRLTIEENDKKLGKPDYQRCLSAAESMRRTGKDAIEVEVASSSQKGHGCKSKQTSPVGEGIDDSVVSVLKTLWFEDGNDYNLYHAAAFYYESAPKEEKMKIDFAIEEFTLK